MLCMYMAGAVTLMDIPGGGNRVVKEFQASLEGDGLEYLIIHGQCIDGCHNLPYDGSAGGKPKERLPKRKMCGSFHQRLFKEKC